MAQLTKYEIAKLPEGNIRNDSFAERLFLSWVYPIVFKGRKEGLLKQDELCMPADQAAEKVVEEFQKKWDEELAIRKKGGKPSLLRALRRAFGWHVFLGGIWKAVWSTLVILGAFYFVRALVQFTYDPKNNRNPYNTSDVPNNGAGWILSCAFFVDSIFVGTALQRMTDACVRSGGKIKAALMAAVYRKTFRLTNLHNEDSGNVVSLVSTDCSKLYEGVLHFHNVWTAPLEAAAIILLLLSATKWVYGLPALGVVVFILPTQYYLGYMIAKYKLENVEVSDSRVLRMHEILLAIKLVKFYVWEKSFSKQVEDVRTKELRLIVKTAFVKTINLCVVFAVPPIIALVIYATYVYNVGKIDSVLAFTVLSLFNTLRFPLVVLPKALRGASEAAASMQRLEQFLLLEEGEEAEKSKIIEARFENAVMFHPSNPNDFKMRIPKFDVKAGEVVAIVGRVGTGKSSVFQAMLGNMKLESGAMCVGGSMAYVPQTPWVQNLSLRENILFGLPYDEAKYKQVIHACALELDLQILPKGDQTMAGERGINLSGGQRQRVCLARAAYHDSDLILLDNPLSAVDQHTARHIFEHCIKGMMKDKAVVWITHQLELLPEVTNISIMQDGTSVYFGPYDPEAMNAFMPVDHLLFATVEAGESGLQKPGQQAAQEDDKHATSDDEEEEKRRAEFVKTNSGRMSFQRSSAAGLRSVDSVGMAMNKLDQEDELRRSQRELKRVSEELAGEHHVPDPDTNLEQSEEEIARLFNGVPKRVSAGRAAWIYLRAGGWMLALFSLVIFMTTQTCRIMSDVWIRWWSADYHHFYTVEADKNGWDEPYVHKVYLLGYFALVMLFLILLLCRDASFSWWSIRASTKLHNEMFRRVLTAPILFFLRTPVGDVLSAFAKDMDTMDETLADTVHMTTIYLMILLTSLAIVTANIYYYAIMVFCLLGAFFVMQVLYLPAATTLKRWAGDSASAVNVHVDESLHGMEVIRAFDAVNYFQQENINRINRNTLASFNTEQCHLWLAFWCDLFGAILVVATCLMSVGLKNDLEPAAVGLAISNTIQVLVFFTWTVRGVADTVSMWDAVERMATFCTRVPIERQICDDAGKQPEPSADDLTKNSKSIFKKHASGPLTTTSSKIGAGFAGELEMVEIKVDADLSDWPRRGDISFKKVYLRYVPGAPFALKKVTFDIFDKEKIGVVGRTGSGKTTLLMALFRMFELSWGKIVIDRRDIAKVPLNEARARIAIIPQEPVMFKGTIRANLDPFGTTSDEELYRSLELVHLKDTVDTMGGIDAQVAEGGSNFSLGQKQLVCLARCVLKKTRILVLDEATAAMDLQTDSLIQKTIRKVFKDRTTITIAHRLDTIIFSDRILAMSSGELKEFDKPTRLLENKNSMFNKLVQDTGPHASAMLRRMAAEGPKDDA